MTKKPTNPLQNPLHDEIMLWLDTNAEDIINKLFYEDWTEANSDVLKHLVWHCNALTSEQIKLSQEKDRLLLSERPSKPKLSIMVKTWAYPLKTATNYQGYFVDMKIEFEDYDLKGHREKEQWPAREDELFIPSPAAVWRATKIKRYVYIEAVPQIESLANLIRRIRIYQRCEAGQYVIASPDDRFQAVLENQGIAFLKFPIEIID